MPSKKKKYNARFPAGRIKKIMQTDEEVGKVAQAVPVIISRTLELFVESLLTKAMQITSAKNAKTLSPSHMKQCILSESRFDFLKDLVKSLPDVSASDEDGTNIPTASCGKLSPVIQQERRSSSTVMNIPQQDCEARLFPQVGSERVHQPVSGVLQPNFYTEVVQHHPAPPPPPSVPTPPLPGTPTLGYQEATPVTDHSTSEHGTLVIDEDYDT